MDERWLGFNKYFRNLPIFENGVRRLALVFTVFAGTMIV